jgi:hypothetical protein
MGRPLTSGRCEERQTDRHRHRHRESLCVGVGVGVFCFFSLETIGSNGFG